MVLDSAALKTVVLLVWNGPIRSWNRETNHGERSSLHGFTTRVSQERLNAIYCTTADGWFSGHCTLSGRIGGAELPEGVVESPITTSAPRGAWNVFYARDNGIQSKLSPRRVVPGTLGPAPIVGQFELSKRSGSALEQPS